MLRRNLARRRMVGLALPLDQPNFCFGISMRLP